LQWTIHGRKLGIYLLYTGILDVNLGWQGLQWTIHGRKLGIYLLYTGILDVNLG